MYSQQINVPYKPDIKNNTDMSKFVNCESVEINETLLDDPNGTIYEWCHDF